MLLQTCQGYVNSRCRWPAAAGRGLRPCSRTPWLPAVPLRSGRIQHSRSLAPQAAAAAAAAASQSESSSASKPLWRAAIDWWDVGVSDNDKNRQPGKLQDTLGMAWQLVAQEKKLMAVASFLMVAASVCELIMPFYYSKIICSISQQGCQQVFKQHLTAYAAAAFGFAVFAGGRGALFGKINNKLSFALRYRLFGVLLREPTDFHDVHEPGQLISRLTSDCYAITRCIATNVNVALRNLLQVIGGGAILLALSPGLSGLCLAIFTLLWGFTIMYGSYSRHSQRVVQDVLASSTACVEEAFVNSKVVRTFGTEQKEQDKYCTWLNKLYDVGMRQSAAWGLYLVAGTSAQSACIALSLLLGGSMVYNGAITPEQLTSFMFYVQLVTNSSLAVCDQYGAIMEAVGASERVLAHLNDAPAPQLAPGVVPQGSLRGEVEMRGVSYTYPNRPDSSALSGVDLWLQPGKLTALVGLSGSGKSTLVSLLQRLYDPTEGQVLVDGYDLTTLDSDWYRARLGVVSQEPRLFSGSVADNIAYGCPFCPSEAQIQEAARAANAHEFIKDLPDGYDTLITDKLLSGGQRQRIALARALVRQPSLLILDEATSALDAESEAAVQEALDRAMQPSESGAGATRTVLVIAHRLSTVRNAHNIVVLDKGKVAEQGSHAELLALKGIYWGLVRRQQKGVGPGDRDLSPRTRDPPMLSSRDWDYGGESSALQNRDSTVSSSTSLRSGSPLPGVIEGTTTAGADSAKGFSDHPSAPKPPTTPQHSRAATPLPSAAASLASHTSFALSVEDEEDDIGDQDDVVPMGHAAAHGAAGGAVQQQPEVEPAGVTAAARDDAQQHPMVQQVRRPEDAQQLVAAAVAGGHGGSNGVSAAASRNGNGKAPAAHNGNGNGNGVPQQQQQQQQLPRSQPVPAANDIVPLGGKVAQERSATDRSSSSSSSNKVHQAVRQ